MGVSKGNQAGLHLLSECTGHLLHKVIPVASMVPCGAVLADELFTLKAIQRNDPFMFLAGRGEGLCWELDQCLLFFYLRDWNYVVSCQCIICLVTIGTSSTHKTTGVAERSCFCVTETCTALTGDFITLSFFQDITYFDQSIDKEHSGEGTGIIACYGNDTVTLGTLHLLVLLLLQ